MRSGSGALSTRGTNLFSDFVLFRSIVAPSHDRHTSLFVMHTKLELLAIRENFLEIPVSFYFF